MKISTNWIKDYVKFRPPLERLAERLTLAGLEVKRIEPAAGSKDCVFEIEITTNRPDWLSHLGVAREIAADPAEILIENSAQRFVLDAAYSNDADAHAQLGSKEGLENSDAFDGSGTRFTSIQRPSIS